MKLTSTCPLGKATKPGMTTFSVNTDGDRAMNMKGEEWHSQANIKSLVLKQCRFGEGG